MQILLVEDNAADAFLVRRALEQHGVRHELTVMSDGEEAIRFIKDVDEAEKTPCPELVLLDLNLPRQDGATVLEALRRSKRCAQTKVVALTSSDAIRDRQHATEQGAAYFCKPLELDDFMSLGAFVKKLLAQSSASGEQISPTA